MSFNLNLKFNKIQNTVYKIKRVIKKILAWAGLLHPSLGIKVKPEVKASALMGYKTDDLNIFVETGTEFGTMIKMIGDNFDKIYTIELNKDLYNKAVQLFKGKEHIKLIQGDSSTEIHKILLELKEPALFWLDAHGPGSMTVRNPQHCPVEKELEAIFAHHVKRHVILVDDARHFDRESISIIKRLAKKNNKKVEIKDGIFRIYGK